MADADRDGRGLSAMTPRPWTISTAVVLFLVAAALRLVSALLGLVGVQEAHDEALRQVLEQAQGARLNQPLVETGLWTGVIVSVVGALFFIVGFVVLALQLRRGEAWARWVLLAFTLLAFSWLLLADIIAALGFLALVVATILIFLPVSRAWYQAERERRIPASFR